MPRINHPILISSLQKAYSGEKAASFAYVGHAGSLQKSQPAIAKNIKEIEDDEWNHREEVLKIMQEYEIPVSKYLEIKMHLIGKVIGYSCYLIGKFIPYFFAGKLESGNVCEYFVMIRHFHSLGITKHDDILFEMGIKEKEHEIFFLEMVKNASWLPFFEKIFKWGEKIKLNDVELDIDKERAIHYCKNFVGK